MSDEVINLLSAGTKGKDPLERVGLNTLRTKGFYSLNIIM